MIVMVAGLGMNIRPLALRSSPLEKK
jgi:hypothetical protein